MCYAVLPALYVAAGADGPPDPCKDLCVVLDRREEKDRGGEHSGRRQPLAKKQFGLPVVSIYLLF